ncbi:sensor histidine kinase [Ruania halotolerans]|uniref:sensor histidine kinase n=1 Tax=Ruania halotolerans TaxID=2897773 RepID=UPI001E53945B|nr:histidine kinase [Ruania halotolerans]UFU08183.1 histidine kinase [Ruania halotolerans]
MHRLAALVHRQDLLVGVVTWLVAMVLVVALPSVAALAGEEMPATSLVNPTLWWLIGGLTAQAAVAAAARSFPFGAVLLVAAVPLLMVWPAHGAAFGLTSVPVLVTVYRAALTRPLTRLRWALAGTVVMFAVAYAANEMLAATGLGPGLVAAAALGQSIVVVGAPLLIALVVAARRDAREAHHKELRALASERDALVQAAIAAQRTTMARELHDIAAHHLSGIALMAAAVDRQIDSDPQAARTSVRLMRQQTSLILDDLRRLVGLLRAEGSEERPLTLAAVPELVDQLSADGQPIQVSILGADTSSLGDRLGPVAHLTAYRMVQESLTNARLHAPGAGRSVEVDDRGEHTVVITVRNEPAQSAAAPGRGGFGLRGMQERADLIGAELSYGPVVDGGWQVRLEIPRTSEREAT